MTYKQHLKEIAKGIFTNSPLSAWELRDMREGLKALAYGLLLIIIRLLLCVLAPVSIPLLAWLSVCVERQERKRR